MAGTNKNRYLEIISNESENISKEWTKLLKEALEYQKDILTENELNQYITDFLRLFQKAIQSGDFKTFENSQWEELRNLLAQIIHKWALQGFGIRETLSFLVTFEKVLFKVIRESSHEKDNKEFDNFTQLEDILREIGQFIAEKHVQSREEIISRQQHEILELSTPVVRLWEGILAVPLIGALDSARTQITMETLLQKIVDTGSELAIIDITGVPAVDTQVAQHIIKTIDATRFMGADCIISGIRPQIAQTMVALGVSFDVMTKATLSDAFHIALRRLGYDIKKIKVDQSRE